VTDRTLSVRISDELHRALSDVAHEHRADMSEIVRPWLRDLALDAERDRVPVHLLDQLEREQLMERNAPKWDRIHFPSRVSYQFRQAFENGDLSVDALGDAAVEEMREIYREEAQRAFDDDDLQRAAVEFVESVADHAAEAADVSDFDALDPEEMFESYQGVETARTREEFDQEELVDTAADRLETPTASPADVTRSLTTTHGVPHDVAQTVVEEATDRLAADETEPESDAGRTTGADLDATEVSESGMVRGAEAEMPDHSEEDVEPAREEIEAAVDLLDSGKASAVVPALLRRDFDISEERSVAARDAALERGGGSDD